MSIALPVFPNYIKCIAQLLNTMVGLKIGLKHKNKSDLTSKWFMSIHFTEVNKGNWCSCWIWQLADSIFSWTHGSESLGRTLPNAHAALGKSNEIYYFPQNYYLCDLALFSENKVRYLLGMLQHWSGLVVGDTVFPLYKGFKIDFLMLLGYPKAHCPSPLPNGIF